VKTFPCWASAAGAFGVVVSFLKASLGFSRSTVPLLLNHADARSLVVLDSLLSGALSGSSF
jgi:hypothetical protein